MMYATFSICEQRKGVLTLLDESALAANPSALCASRGEGPLRIQAPDQPAVEVFDELVSAVLRLCFQSIVVLRARPDATYTYLYMTSARRIDI